MISLASKSFPDRPLIGDQRWDLTIPLKDGETLCLALGREDFVKIAGVVLAMLKDEPENEAAARLVCDELRGEHNGRRPTRPEKKAAKEELF